MESIRVLHVIWSMEYGGIERVVRDLIEEQIAVGQDVALFSARQRGSWMEDVARAGEIHFGGVRGGWDVSAATVMRLKKLFAKHDLLHTHTLSPVIEIAAWLSGTPIVHTVHGGKGINASMTMSARVLNLMHGFFLRCSRVLVVANSEWTANRAAVVYNIDRKRISVIHNGTSIRPNEDESEQVVDNSNAFIIGTASRLVKSKRIDRLIEAINVLTHTHKNIKLLIAGSGPEEGALKKSVLQYGINEHVRFLGYVEDIEAYFRSLSIAVFPAASEPFGLVAVEAMKVGRPVVVFSDAGGMAEVVGGYSTSNVVSTVEELCGRLLELKNDSDLSIAVDKMVNYAKQFSANRMREKYWAIYRLARDIKKAGIAFSTKGH